MTDFLDRIESSAKADFRLQCPACYHDQFNRATEIYQCAKCCHLWNRDELHRPGQTTLALINIIRTQGAALEEATRHGDPIVVLRGALTSVKAIIDEMEKTNG